MQTTEKVVRYLDAMVFDRKKTGAEGGGLYPFVTISRQAGANAGALGAAVIAELEGSSDPDLRNWQMFDQELCRMAAEDRKLKVSMKQLLSEEFHGQIQDYVFKYVAGTSPQPTVYAKISEVIRTLALVGKCVIVGRGGCCLTRDLPGGVHVRLVASKATRLTRLMDRDGTTKAEAEKELRRRDRARASLIRSFFKKDIEDPLLYDAVWNADTLKPSTIARQIAALVGERAARLSQLHARERTAA